MVIVETVDNRVLLLGLDAHYREAMKLFEATSLLGCARAVAGALGRKPEPVAVEGYYSHTPELTEYFLLMRALQDVRAEESEPARSLPELARLLEVTGARIFGKPQFVIGGEEMMLPRGRDPLSQALLALQPDDWDVRRLLDAAFEAAIERDAISLVALAVRARDEVVTTALRESVILYAEKVEHIGDMDDDAIEYRYEWRVDPALAEAANRFIRAFNALVADANARVDSEQRFSGAFRHTAFQPIPPATAQHAAHFHRECADNEILGRCANLGSRRDTRRLYHWAITSRGGEFQVVDFWDADLWSTDRYRREHAATLRGAPAYFPRSVQLPEPQPRTVDI